MPACFVDINFSAATIDAPLAGRCHMAGQKKTGRISPTGLNFGRFPQT